MHKTWNKPMHKRKLVSTRSETAGKLYKSLSQWHSVSMPGKLVYYMQPLVEHLFDIWMQPLPFPTLLKFAYSCGLFFFILLPILYPLAALGLYYGIFQYVGEQHFEADLPDNWDLLGEVQQLWRFEVTNKKYLMFVTMYIDRYRVIITAVCSTVDYTRMALSFVFS